MTGAKRQVGPFQVEPIGLGAMGLSHAYGTPPGPQAAARLLDAAIDLGIDFIDTAALYGFGQNETLVGEALAGRRNRFALASKCGMTGVNGKRVIDGRPETLLRTLDEALSRLRTDVIDLYYLHRRDFAVPIEDSVGALAKMVEEGKVRAIGLSEVSADTLARAHAVHPIAAVQTEYSPWSRDAELRVLGTSARLESAFVAFSPLARGFLADVIHGRDSLPDGDIRRAMPRFSEANLPRNLQVLERFRAVATAAGLRPAQLSLAWALAKASHLIAIPGTTNEAHLRENFEARHIRLEADLVAAVDDAVNDASVSGARYPESTYAEIDTERR